MSEFAARIGRVRMKSGGADLRIIDRKPTHYEDENWQGRMVTNARRIADMSDEESALTGYLVLGIFEGGLTALGFRYDNERCHVPKALIPAWIAEVLRRDLLTAPEAEEVFDRNFQWVE